MNKLNEVKKYLKSKPNLYIGWSYSTECPDIYPVYETKAECVRARKELFKEENFENRNYSKEQLDRWYEVRAFVFARKFGLEENVAVCSVDEFKFS